MKLVFCYRYIGGICSPWLVLTCLARTKYITVGGAVAADIHGKNHHIEGSFGSHVLSLDVMRANGEMIHCSPEINKEFFTLTVGGMGLSGMIINITFKMKPIESS